MHVDPTSAPRCRRASLVSLAVSLHARRQTHQVVPIANAEREVLPLALVETFVEQERFRGTVYQAANWQHVGATQGRTRQDRYSTLRVPVKDLYVYPLAKNFRGKLRHEPA